MKKLVSVPLLSLVLLIGATFLISSSTSAKTQYINRSITHDQYSGSCGTCVDVQLIVVYTFNGQGYSQISGSQNLTPSDTGNFSVGIPATATILEVKFKFTMDTENVLHNENQTTEQHYYSSGDYCSCSDDTSHLFVFTYGATYSFYITDELGI